MTRAIRTLLILLGGLLTADSLILMGRTNGNLGIWLPGIMGLPLLLSGLFYKHLSPLLSTGFGRLLRFFMIVGYCLALLYFSVMSAFLYCAGSQSAPEGADALIVLGCGLYGERPSLTLTRRLDLAYNYLMENPDTLCVVSGGQGPGEDIPEALAMQRYLLEKGLPEGRILMEKNSKSTYENFSFSKALIEERLGAEVRVVFVTTRFHVYRAGRVAEKAGIEAQGLGSHSLWYIAPNDYLRECCALPIYWLTGKI